MRGLAVVLAGCALVGCMIDIKARDGEVVCGPGGICPDGLTCQTSTQRCFRLVGTGTKTNGESCAGAGECASGACADGVCCDTPCDGQCESCSAAGVCEATTGAPLGGRPACDGTGVCAGTCDGSNRAECVFPQVECVAASCEGGVATAAAVCSNGTCPAPLTTNCANTADAKYCGATSCVGVTQLQASSYSVHALMSDGSVYGWGANFSGMLGVGQSEAMLTISHRPLRLPGLTNVTRLTSSPEAYATCALLADQTVRCWGANGSGQLGLNGKDALDHPTPSPVVASALGTPLAGIIDVGMGESFACALNTAKDTVCWGLNSSGQLANPTTLAESLLPVAITPAGTKLEGISLGSAFACGYTSDLPPKMKCWGANGSYQTGIGTQTTPVTAATEQPMFNLDRNRARPMVTAINNGCGINTSGELLCWGFNQHGQLGRADGGTASSTATQAPVCDANVMGCANASDRLSGVSQASMSYKFACAISNATVHCWGFSDYGELGGPDFSYYAQPVAQLPNASQVTTGGYHACALLSDRTVRCWGSNEEGQLGHDMPLVTSSATPVAPAF